MEYISPNIEKNFGISVDQMKKNPQLLLDYIDMKHRATITSFFTTNSLSRNHEEEFLLLHPDNNTIEKYILRIYPIYKNRMLERYIISISNLEMEQQGEQTIKDALLKVQRTNDAKKDFLCHICHEIKTPLNAIIGMTQIAEHSPQDMDKVKHCLSSIYKASNQLIAMVNQILDLNKMDSNKLLIHHELFPLDQLLDDLYSMILYEVEIKQLTFTVQRKDLVHPYVLGDPLRLRQILLNCISNSIKFTSQGGNISLEVKEISQTPHKANIYFIISDTGKGMSEEYIKRIFIPFEQEDDHIFSEYGGSGLGMSITQNLVSLMSGDIDVQSSMNKGTTITIRIPFDLPNSYSSNDYSMEQESPLLQSSLDLSPYRILVVEDNEINLEIICELLHLTNIQIDTASNGLEAFQRFSTSKKDYYQAILMDLQMPSVDGYEATRLIRQSIHPNAQDICIIALSAYTSDEDISLAFKAGMNYHISKPVKLQDIIHLLRDIFISL